MTGKKTRVEEVPPAQESPLQESIKDFADRTLKQIPEIATKGVDAGFSLARTKTGSRAITGAAAGAAIAAALPFASILGGALLGAGALVMWKTAKDDD